jgi:hypothetical protein
MVDKNYNRLKLNVDNFRKNLQWDIVARQHIDIYKKILDVKKDEDEYNKLITTEPAKLKPKK